MQKNHHTVPNAIMFEEVSRLLEQGKEVTIKVGGNSMLPFIKGLKDSIVIVKPDNLETGDIVLARLTDSSEYVIHRILEFSGPQVILMGDGNLVGTETCRREDVKGKIIRIIHPDGTAIDCNRPDERRKARIWRRLRPVRRYLLYFYKKVNRI